LIDPLLSPLTAKPFTVFPNVTGKTSTTGTAAAGASVGGTGGGVDFTKRYDLEYRYPYKSFIPPGERGGGGMAANQNIYAMNLGTNVLLTSPSLVQDMVQVVLTRRKMEEKFNSVCFSVLPDYPFLTSFFLSLLLVQVLNKYIDSIILDTVEHVNSNPLQKKNPHQQGPNTRMKNK
jgi:hypothetical protein